VAIVWLGLYPKPVLDTAKPAIQKTLNKQKELSFQKRTLNTLDYSLGFLPPSHPSPKGEGESKRQGIISPLGETGKGVR
jgi:hypothetical protein